MGYITCKAAGRKLGVDPELIRGLVIGGKIAGVKSTGASGVTVWLVDSEDVKRVRELLHKQ